jgi:hypothetical protein
MTAHEILKAAQALGEERGWHEKGVVARDGTVSASWARQTLWRPAIPASDRGDSRLST